MHEGRGIEKNGSFGFHEKKMSQNENKYRVYILRGSLAIGQANVVAYYNTGRQSTGSLSPTILSSTDQVVISQIFKDNQKERPDQVALFHLKIGGGDRN
ncbi:MAG: hypothetical protein IPG22_20445 [Acidobacteria bacterium]|nr:hypothetical protein [Acidobacteriota bacterium]